MQLKDFAITQQWPAQYPDRIQLYSLGTPNGLKASIALRELDLPYELHVVDITRGDQMTEGFLALNPNNKIQAMIDPNGPAGEPVAVWESGAILIYLAEKAGQLLPTAGQSRYAVLQWLMWQMGGLGPMMGQVGFFHKYAGREFDDKRPLQRFVDESRRLLGVLDRQLDGRDWLVVDAFSIADIAVFPWVRNFVGWYDAGKLVQSENFKNVQRVFSGFVARDAVRAALEEAA